MKIIPKMCLECPLCGTIYYKGDEWSICQHPKSKKEIPIISELFCDDDKERELISPLSDKIPFNCPLLKEELILGPIS